MTGFVFEFKHVLLEPPHRFGEEMVRGPFRHLRHVHEFEEVPGGTLVRDRLDLSLPVWLGGTLAERWVAGPRIRRVFRQRQEAMAKLLGFL